MKKPTPRSPQEIESLVAVRNLLNQYRQLFLEIEKGDVTSLDALRTCAGFSAREFGEASGALYQVLYPEG